MFLCGKGDGVSIEEISAKWYLKGQNKQASIDMWDSMAQGYDKGVSISCEDDNYWQLFKRHNMFDAASSVLDVGCGTGNYALMLAGSCKEVVGVDLSPKMLEIARRKASDKKMGNIDFRRLDWHEADLRREGLEKRFDLVIALTTPAVQSADTFLKLTQASRGWCVLAKPTRRTDSVFDEVNKLVGISEKRESSDVDIIYAFELLWRQGLSPYLEYKQQRWSMRKTPEEAYGMYINRVKTYRDISFDEEEKIKAYLQSIAKDGLICEDVDTTVTTIYWHV